MNSAIQEVAQAMPSQQIVISALGGAMVSVLNFLELAKLPATRRPTLDWFYWVTFILWPLLGGLVGFLYTDPAAPIGRIASFQLGMSTPLILRTAATAAQQSQTTTVPPDA